MQHNIQPNHYQPSPADLVTDLERISRFFLNEAAVKKQLAKLEQALEVEAGERIGANKLFKDYVPNQPYKHQKLLSAFFKSWGSANGFNGWKALDGHQTNQSFYQTLFDGLLFKDSHFRSPIKSKHGEYSHLLLWYCLVEQNNDEKFLTHLHF